MRYILVAISLSALAGCSRPEPLIDHINVNDAKYTRDLSECRDETKGSWMPFSGGSVSDCMRGRGYHVLMDNSGL